MQALWKRCLAWYREYFVSSWFAVAAFLLLFIPLMPKIPLADLIPGYIVRLRAEDVLVFVTFVCYVISCWRGKTNWRLPTWQLIFGYVAIGAMSILSGVVFLHTIPVGWPAAGQEGWLGTLATMNIHLLKSLLHWARYIEYFFLAFLFFSSLKTTKQLQTVFVLMLTAVAAVSIYGFGQKYFYWPVYSTMNREFSKGVRLVLTPHARVQSTFAGHYDFAGYLVLLLPFTLLIARHARRRGFQVFAWLCHFMGVWSLIVSAARTSIIAYFAAAFLIIALDICLLKGKALQKIGHTCGQELLYFFVVGILVFGWGQDMIERFAHVLDRIEPLHNAYHTANRWRKELPYLLGWREMEQPEGAIAVVVDELGNNSVVTPTDTRPAPVSATPTPTPEPTGNKPADVYVDVPDIKVAIDATGNAYYYEATRTWSVNAEKYGLSMAIRFDTLWPNAWRGFLRNPLLGSGYATLTKGESLSVFTEADSTDNNYLRVLGETGILGFVTFYGCIAIALYSACRQLKRIGRDALTYNLAFIGATVGILINALYIDVFAASKVAFTYWMIFGLFWAQVPLLDKLAAGDDEK